MKITYEGIGQLCATFACADTMTEGTLVKVSANEEVAACAADDKFCGVCAAVGRDGKACSVQLRGFVTLTYSGSTAPAVGYGKLVADGSNGVKVSSSGSEYLIAQVNTDAKTATIML